MKKKILAALLTAGGGVKTPQETRQQEAQTM